MPEETVLTERLSGDIVVLSIDHPPANAVDSHTIRRLLETFQGIIADQTIRAVVLRGAGPRFFCTGGDYKELATLTMEQGVDRIRTFHHLLALMEKLPLPLVTAVNGDAVGGGLEFALAGDYVISVPYARFGFPEINNGLLSDARGMRRLIDLFGLRTARTLLYYGNLYNAEHAAGMGLIDEIVDPDELMARAVDQASILGEKDRRLFGAIKRTLAEAPSMRDEEFEELAVKDFQSYFGTEEMFARLNPRLKGKSAAR